MRQDTILKPTEKTLRLLYAKSGNRCAFPSCPIPISDGKTLYGEAAHIKAESPGGPRYDLSQTPEERRSFENLILLCGVHHKCVDSDPISYTVDRLKQMKLDHESKAGVIEDSEADQVAKMLAARDIINVNAINPYNSVTAAVFNQNVTNNFASSPEPNALDTATPYRGVLPKNGMGSFRAHGEPIGSTQSIMPFQLEPSSEVFMDEDKPCFWFRMFPNTLLRSEFTFRDLELSTGDGTGFRLVTMHGHADYRLRAKDGIGRYLSIRPSIAYAATFLFRVGEVWSIDTELCVNYGESLFALSQTRKGLPSLISQFSAVLTALNVSSPFRWIVGLEGAGGYRVAFDRRNGYSFSRPEILTDRIICEGLFSSGEDAQSIVEQFSRKVFAECGLEQPQDIV
jgi:hypothetical protein